MRPPILHLSLSAALGLSLAAFAPAATVTPLNQIGTAFTPSGTDLLQTRLSGSPTTVGNFTLDGGAGIAVLYDGLFGNPGGAPNGGTGFATAGIGNTADPGEGRSVVFNLDLTASPSGYNLFSIATYAGGDGYRGAQEYTVSYSTVAAPGTFVSIATVDDDYTASTDGGVAGNHNSKVTITDPASGPLASGVASVKFVFADSNSTHGVTPNGYNNYREIDVIGSAVPEPASALILGGAAVGLLARRRRA